MTWRQAWNGSAFFTPLPASVAHRAHVLTASGGTVTRPLLTAEELAAARTASNAPGLGSNCVESADRKHFLRAVGEAERRGTSTRVSRHYAGRSVLRRLRLVAGMIERIGIAIEDSSPAVKRFVAQLIINFDAELLNACSGGDILLLELLISEV